jgi:hypothetical protein
MVLFNFVCATECSLIKQCLNLGIFFHVNKLRYFVQMLSFNIICTTWESGATHFMYCVKCVFIFYAGIKYRSDTSSIMY